MIASDTIVIRRAGAADIRVLARLAALDSAATPAADSLIAELDGVAVAALDLADGQIITDPFARSVDLVELLRLRAARVRAAQRRAAPALTRRPRAGCSSAPEHATPPRAAELPGACADMTACADARPPGGSRRPRRGPLRLRRGAPRRARDDEHARGPQRAGRARRRGVRRGHRRPRPRRRRAGASPRPATRPARAPRRALAAALGDRRGAARRPADRRWRRSRPPRGHWAAPCELDPFDVPLEDKLDAAVRRRGGAARRRRAIVRAARLEPARARSARRSRRPRAPRARRQLVECGGGMQARRGRTATSCRSARTRAPTAATSRPAGWEHVLALDLAGNAPRVAEEAVELLTAPQCPDGPHDARPRRRAARAADARVDRPRARARPHPARRGVLRRDELGRRRPTSARCATAPST